MPTTELSAAQSRLPLIATIGVAILAIVVVWMWIAERRSTPQPPPTTATAPAAPVDPTAAVLRQARASLEAKDYASAQKFAEAILVTVPDQAEARKIRDTARDQLVQAALRTAQEHLAAGDFAEASRAAGTVLALDPGNAEAKRITEQGSVRERTRAADEGRARMNEARASALAAGATRLAPAAFRAATRVDQDALRLYKAGRLSEAMSRFYEASGLYRSAETTANSEAALQRSTPAQPHTQPATPPASPPSIPPPSASPAVPAPTVEAPQETAKPQVTAPVTPAPQPAAKPPEPLPPPPAAPAPSTRPLPSPPVAQPLDLPARSPTAEERIQELLSRYKSAMESRSLEDLKRIWPGLGGAQLDALRRQFQEASSISVDVIDPHIQLTGATGTSATVTFTRHYVVTFSGQSKPEQSDSRTVMEVRRNGNAWVIDSMRFR